MATACLRFFTFPPLPDFRLPCLNSRMVLATFVFPLLDLLFVDRLLLELPFCAIASSHSLDQQLPELFQPRLLALLARLFVRGYACLYKPDRALRAANSFDFETLAALLVVRNKELLGLIQQRLDRKSTRLNS